MTHARLIARELKLRGFAAEVTASGVVVSLERNTISIMEVADALALSFEDIKFNFTKLSANKVLVQE